MARIVSLGGALQETYLIDRDDFVGSKVGDQSIFGKIAIGDEIDIDRAEFQVGGGGVNAATSFARYGHETIYLGSLTRDTAGEAVLACLDDECIDSSYVDYVRGGTGCSVVLLDAKSGQHTVLTHFGAASKFKNLDCDDLSLIAPDWLYASTLQGDMDTLLAFFEKAHELGIKVMFNPGLAELKELPKFLGLLEDVDVLIMNKREAATVVPGVLLTELLVHLAAYCPTVIITDGEMGAIATDHHEIYRLGVYEQVRRRDAAGAGDAFGAGFLAALADGQKFKSALIYAAANATSVIQSYGSRAGILCGREDLHPMPIQLVKDIQLS